MTRSATRSTSLDVFFFSIDNLGNKTIVTIRAILCQRLPRKGFPVDEEIQYSIDYKFQEGNIFYRRGTEITAVSIEDILDII